MLRVMRNHRNARVWQDRRLRRLGREASSIGSQELPRSTLVGLAEAAWDEALALGEQHGYRNAQVSVIAPTGTIGLVMDCDTTGIEPDFALVKFKKLAGGGYFKIINQSVPPHWQNWATAQPDRRDHFLRGWSRHNGQRAGHQPHIADGHGFGQNELDKIEARLPTAFDIRFVFNQWTLGEEFCKGTWAFPKKS